MKIQLDAGSSRNSKQDTYRDFQMQIRQSEPAEYHTQREDLKVCQREKTNYLQGRSNETDVVSLTK